MPFCATGYGVQQETMPIVRWWLTVLSRSSTQSIGNGPSSFSAPVETVAGVGVAEAEDAPLLFASISSALRLSDAMNRIRTSNLSFPTQVCCGFCGKVLVVLSACGLWRSFAGLLRLSRSPSLVGTLMKAGAPALTLFDT